MTAIPSPALPETEPRISVRDETDIRVLIAALSLYAAHTHSDTLAQTAESLAEVLASSPSGHGYSSRKALPVTGAQIPERR